ncbi:hypothetical protein AC1031_011096 [Aphanomyces cochlioides]|nr:hypothetical protein AC1031_011096 [Aphanomyces cochlioides]
MKLGEHPDFQPYLQNARVPVSRDFKSLTAHRFIRETANLDIAINETMSSSWKIAVNHDDTHYHFCAGDSQSQPFSWQGLLALAVRKPFSRDESLCSRSSTSGYEKEA